MRKIVSALLLGLVFSILVPLSGMGAENELHFLLNPALVVGYDGLAFDFISLGFTTSEKQPVLLLKVGYVRAGLTFTPPLLTGESMEWNLFDGWIVPSLCIGLDAYRPWSPYPIFPFFELGAFWVKGSFFLRGGLSWPWTFYIGLGWII